MKWVTWWTCIMSCFSCCQWEAQPIKREISWTHRGHSRLITWERSQPRSELSLLTAAHNAPVLLGFCFCFPPKSLSPQLMPHSPWKGTSFRMRFPKKLTLLRCASRHLNARAGSLYVVSLKKGHMFTSESRIGGLFLWSWFLFIYLSIFGLFLVSFPLVLFYICFLCSITYFFLFILIGNSLMTAIIRDVICLLFSMVGPEWWCPGQKTQAMGLFQEGSTLQLSGSLRDIQVMEK